MIIAAQNGETATCRLFMKTTNIYVRNDEGKTVLIKATPDIAETKKAASIDIQE